MANSRRNANTTRNTVDSIENRVSTAETNITNLQVQPTNAKATGSGGSTASTSFVSTGTGFSFTFGSKPVVIQYNGSAYCAASGVMGSMCIFINGVKVGTQADNMAMNGATTGFYQHYAGQHIVFPGDITPGTYTVAIAWKTTNGSFPITGNEREIIAFTLGQG